MTNPLSNYYRTAGVHIKLPSEGKYWAEGSIQMPPNGELPVLPMNGRDDLSLRNADGLMNGSTTVDVIQSCLPNVKDAWAMPMIDVDAILIAIRQASYGQNMAFTTKCSKCGEFHDYEIDLGTIRDTIHIPDYSQPLMLNDLLISIKPASYAMSNASNQEKYAHQRAIQAIQDSTGTEEEKIAKFKETLTELTADTVAKVAAFVEYIITPTGEKVTDIEFIKEFVANADQKTFNTLRTFITEKNGEYKIDPVTTICTECGHEEKKAFQFDPSNFFG